MEAVIPVITKDLHKLANSSKMEFHNCTDRTMYVTWISACQPTHIVVEPGQTNVCLCDFRNLWDTVSISLAVQAYEASWYEMVRKTAVSNEFWIVHSDDYMATVYPVDHDFSSVCKTFNKGRLKTKSKVTNLKFYSCNSHRRYKRKINV
jgi:hypothetical protein